MDLILTLDTFAFYLDKSFIVVVATIFRYSIVFLVLNESSDMVSSLASLGRVTNSLG